MTTAKIITDSISESGIRIVTMELTYPYYIHAQVMTHRQFSRNGKSYRAVPTSKIIDEVKNTPAPHFLKNKAGMQATEEFKEWEHDYAVSYWNQAREYAINQAEVMLDLGVHKQYVNRLLLPFSTMRLVVTATEWENFFGLRLHHAAQPEMQALAQAMKAVMDESVPKQLNGDEWHLPYISNDYYSNCTKNDLALISAARCARVSYLNHDNSTPNIEKDLELARQLLADKHLSPFEHQAKPINDYDVFKEISLAAKDKNLDKFGITHIDKNDTFWSGNFKGWASHRHLI